MEIFLGYLAIAWIIWFFIINTIYVFLMTKFKKKKYMQYYDSLKSPKAGGCNPFQVIYLIIYGEKIEQDYRENILEDELNKYYDIDKVNELFEMYDITKEKEKSDRLFHLLLYHHKYEKLVGWPYFVVRPYTTIPSKEKIEELKKEELFKELIKTKRDKKNEN